MNRFSKDRRFEFALLMLMSTIDLQRALRDLMF
jgi:hypothetical protein